jgi:hypothetical protein
MIGKLFTLAFIIGASYWYYNGPYQDRVNPSYETRLENYAGEMRLCIRGLNYKSGSTGEVQSGTPEDICARQNNFYRKDGKWHSYDEARRDR